MGLPAMRRLAPKREPRSACPRCYRDNEPVGYLTDSHLLTFHCECGEHWVSASKRATAHADWLGKAHHQHDIGDK